ncbi:MAG: amidase [Geminocystis sp.]|nr:amidase [Geminocystis sp.]MCS7147674.1 amidase [Geminocystis sp.]MCX8078483.1 amidase [Geminocystis sp.]MDW8117228.1 amidase [Geminocystis sp.]MDW8463811.1 amidase [Geminocystis sp.]
MQREEITELSALQLADLIRKKDLSPLELLQCYISRIEKYAESLGCFAYIDLEGALAKARLQTEIIGKTKDRSSLPPFFGIPTAIKDLYAVEGMPTGYGNALLQSRKQVATYSEEITKRLEAAGFIIIGKTATSEFGTLPYTESPGLPPCRNPWNLEHTAGGSSGGAAAAVAAGLLPLAPGSDGGGSIRGPAFCCGIVGLKPSRGRISNAPVGEYPGGIATHGCLTRTVADSAALLDILSGYVVGDPYWLPNPPTPFLDSISQPPSSLKIAFTTSVLPSTTTHPSVQQEVESIARILEGMGHQIIPVSPDFTPLVEPFRLIWQSTLAALQISPSILSPMNQWLLANAPDLGTYLRALAQMHQISRQILSFFQEFDILLLPTYLSPPIKIGAWAEKPPEEILSEIIRWINPCPPFNATGQPAISLPTGFTTDGLPLGIQLVAKPAQDSLLLQLAHQLEMSLPPRMTTLPPFLSSPP